MNDMYAMSSLHLCFGSDSREYTQWREGVGRLLDKFCRAKGDTQRRIEKARSEAVKHGKLLVSVDRKAGARWEEMPVILTPTELLVLRRNDEEHQLEVQIMLEMRPNCAVYETNLGDFAFEVVSAQQAVHLQASSSKDCAAWLHALRTTVTASQPEESDPLVALALQKVDEDVFYDVSFHEKKQLGVVFERSGEWAIVKHSNSRATGIHIGSVLTSINGQSCMLTPYDGCIELLKDWRPPLHLGFRRASQKEGYLVKLSRERKGKAQNSWKERYFILSEGRLVYKNTEAVDDPIKGELPLMGSAVCLVSSTETGKFFCFRIVSGSESMVMQAVDMDEMMDWAATLYHASAVANGGLHVLSMERRRLQEKTEESDRMQREGQKQEEAGGGGELHVAS